MSDYSNEHDKGADEMGDVGRLIHYAGGREAVDAARMNNARERVGAHWETVVAERRAARAPARLRPVALAASVVAVAGISLVLLQSGPGPQPVALASVDRIVGEVRIAGRLAGAGDAIAPDAVIETGPAGRIALRLAGGQSLRIDTASRLLVHSPNHVSLESGGIYIDTVPAADPAPVRVATALGSAWDVGTQFQVRLDAGALQVGVRDGLVKVERPGERDLSVNAGYFVAVDASGEVSEQPIDEDDPHWQWVESVAPQFALEGASLKEYLVWYARERGLSLDWADTASQINAARTTLSGETVGSDSLDVVRRIASFDYRIEDDTLWIRVD